MYVGLGMCYEILCVYYQICMLSYTLVGLIISRGGFNTHYVVGLIISRGGGFNTHYVVV
jgi:hypothetical protein